MAYNKCSGTCQEISPKVKLYKIQCTKVKKKKILSKNGFKILRKKHQK